MSTFYETDIGPAVLDFIYDLTVLSTAYPIVARTTGDGTAVAVTTSSAGPAHLSVVRNGGSHMQQAAAGVGIWASDWLLYGDLDAGVLAQDTITDGALAYLVTGAPETDLGFLLAPVEKAELPNLSAPLIAGFRQGLRGGMQL